jgi:hypothetical protein
MWKTVIFIPIFVYYLCMPQWKKCNFYFCCLMYLTHLLLFHVVSVPSEMMNGGLAEIILSKLSQNNIATFPIYSTSLTLCLDSYSALCRSTTHNLCGKRPVLIPFISVFAKGSYKKCLLALLPGSSTTIYPSRHTNLAPTRWIFSKLCIGNLSCIFGLWSCFNFNQ